MELLRNYLKLAKIMPSHVGEGAPCHPKTSILEILEMQQRSQTWLSQEFYKYLKGGLFTQYNASGYEHFFLTPSKA
jgi:hypothetical protein